MTMLFILCVKQQLAAIVEEMQDWKAEGAKIFLYGITNKAAYGFLILEWGKPIPDLFVKKLREDTDVIDYVVLGKDIPPTATPALTIPTVPA